MRNKKKGFTLVELIVVIAIIGVLAAIIVPTTLHFVNQARDQAAVEELDRVASAFDSGLTEIVAEMSGTATISATNINDIVSRAGITADALENTITVTITDDNGTMVVTIKSDYSTESEYTITRRYAEFGKYVGKDSNAITDYNIASTSAPAGE